MCSRATVIKYLRGSGSRASVRGYVWPQISNALETLIRPSPETLEISQVIIDNTKDIKDNTWVCICSTENHEFLETIETITLFKTSCWIRYPYMPYTQLSVRTVASVIPTTTTCQVAKAKAKHLHLHMPLHRGNLLWASLGQA